MIALDLGVSPQGRCPWSFVSNQSGPGHSVSNILRTVNG